MKRKSIKRFMTCLMAAVMCLTVSTAFVGCSSGGGNEKPVDPNKTQLYLGVTSEGLDESWLSPLIDEFEKTYPQYQVYIDPIATEDVPAIETDMPSQRQDLYFLQSLSQQENLFKQGFLEDITDIVTVGDSAFENGTSIESKIKEEYKKRYQSVGADGNARYFGIPYASLPYGIIYDADLFESKSLYNLPSYKGLDGIGGNADDKYGPDGLPNTYDDGLPATWEDFKELIKAMPKKGVTPFVWSGEHSSYRLNFMHALVAGYEGADQYRQYYDFEGTDYNSGQEISLSNGYLLVNRPGQQAALQAAYDIVSKTENFSNKSFFLSTTHLGAQNEFILSTRTSSPIGMLLEGIWWEHEAAATFKEMEGFGSQYGYGQRNFKFMPLPKFIGTSGIADQTNTKRTVYEITGQAIVCMNAASQHKDGAELFLRFVHTDKALKAFTLDNGLLRPYNYTLSDEEYNKLTPFGRSVWDMWTSENVELTHSLVFKDEVLANSAYTSGLQFNSEYGEDAFTDPMRAFFSNEGLTVQQYMQGKANVYNATRWANSII